MKKILLGTLAFVVATFAIEGTSHFVINKDFYANIPFVRQDPVIIMGFLTMIVQGIVMSWMYTRFHDPKKPVLSGWIFAMCMALVLVGYIAVVEPHKYTVPSVGQWFRVEATAGFLQFSLFGVLLGLVHGRKA